MKTTSKIAVAAFLIGSCGLGTRAAESAGAHFRLVSAAEPTEMSACALSLSYEQAMQILSAAHEQYWYDQITMADLVQRYDSGICTIEKVSEGYKVNGGGGLGIITVLDDF